MENILGELGDPGLRFMGQMNASISHEIKNTLAIMKENAGLLDDLAGLARTGRSALDPERVMSLSQRIVRQIQRADVLAANMNRLAHSVDQVLAQIDVPSTLLFMLQITDRLTAYRGVVVEYTGCEEKIHLFTCPLLFMHLIWEFTCLAIRWADEQKKLGVEAEAIDHGALIRFSGLDSALLPDNQQDLEPEHQALLKLAKAGFQPDKAGTCFALAIKSLDRDANR